MHHQDTLEWPATFGSLPLPDHFGSLTLCEQRGLAPGLTTLADTSTCWSHSGAAVSASYGAPPIAGVSHPLLVTMPRRKRSSPSQEETRNKRQRTAARKKTAESESVFSTKRCIMMYHEYASVDDDIIGPEGMEKFCEDISVEPENIVMLCLAWKLDAKQMGFFTKVEWLRGMTELGCDTVTKVQGRLEYLKSLLDDSSTYKSIYRYAFDFAKEKDQRSLDMDTAKAMLALLLGRNWSLFGTFHQFLEQSRYKVINKDQWYNVLEFSRLIKPDLSNYDEDGAWPVLLDEFVEWYRELKGIVIESRTPNTPPYTADTMQYC